MKILGGECRGMNLYSPKGMKTRPMVARIKQSLFNILGDLVADANVLDLFSGSGSLGLEALSRGAKHCHFVENGHHVLPVLDANIKKSGYTDYSTIVKCNAFSIMENLTDEKFDIIFLDPPYKHIDEVPLRFQFLQFIAKIAENHTNQYYIMVLHHRLNSMLGASLPLPLKQYDQRKYGSAELLFLCDNEE